MKEVAVKYDSREKIRGLLDPRDNGDVIGFEK